MTNEAREERESKRSRRAGALLGFFKRNPKVLLPIGVLTLGLVLSGALVMARPSVAVRQPAKIIPLVRVVPAVPTSTHLTIRSQGSVSPRTESDLIAEVSGRITWVSPSLAAGGFVAAGDPLVRIDPRDYEVAVTRSEAALARAESQLALAGRNRTRLQQLASRGVASPVALDDAENAAQVAAANRLDAEAARAQARHNLERTQITAPFLGRVRAKHVGLGQFVNRGAAVARVYAVDYAEVRLPIPDDAAAHVDLPNDYLGDAAEGHQPAVTLTAEFGGRAHQWTGTIVRTEGELDPRTRMIHAVVRVEDPYAHDAQTDRAPLAVGMFVEAEIQGRRIEDVYSLPKSAMRGSDRVVIVNDEGRAYARQVKLLQRLSDRVLIESGLEPGDRIVTSPLTLTVDGMRVDVAEATGDEPVP